MFNIGKDIAQNVVFKAIEGKIKEIKPQEVIEVFGHMVQNEVAELKKDDNDGNGVKDFDDVEAELKKMSESAHRIAHLLELANQKK